METLEIDLPILMAKISQSEFNTTSLLGIISNKTKKDNILCLLKSVKTEVIQKLIDMFKKDFLMFGYDMNHYLNLTSIQC